MLTYEGCFGEKGFEEDFEIEWERKTIEGNVCIRPLGDPLGSGDKWFEEVEEQFVWPGRPALLPDGRLCVPEARGDRGRELLALALALRLGLRLGLWGSGLYEAVSASRMGVMALLLAPPKKATSTWQPSAAELDANASSRWQTRRRGPRTRRHGSACMTASSVSASRSSR